MKNWKSIVGVLLVFVLGMAAGLLLAYAISPGRRVMHGGPPVLREMIVRRLTTELNLDATQQQEVTRIVKESQQEMATVRQQARQITEQAEAKIRQVLRPEQLAQYERMQQRWRERAMQFERERPMMRDRERPSRPPGPGPHRPGEPEP